MIKTDVLQRFPSHDFCDAALAIFNKIEEFEQDDKYADKAQKNQRIQVFSKTQQMGYRTGKSGKKNKDADDDPNDHGSGYFKKRLSFFLFEKSNDPVQNKKKR